MSYLTYSPATSKYPVRGFSNPNYLKSPDALEINYQEFTWVSDGDTNGIIYYLGATKHSESFTNPHDRGEIVVTAADYIDTRIPSNVTDRANVPVQADYWHSAAGGNKWIKIEFVNGTVEPSKFLFKTSAASPLHAVTGTHELHGSNDNSNWVMLESVAFDVGSGAYSSFNPTPLGDYKDLRMSEVGGDYFQLDEIEIYGKYYAI